MITAARPWHVLAVPSRGGDIWESGLATVADATRVRQDLRARLKRSLLGGDCTQDAGEDLLLVFEELTSNALRLRRRRLLWTMGLDSSIPTAGTSAVRSSA